MLREMREVAVERSCGCALFAAAGCRASSLAVLFDCAKEQLAHYEKLQVRCSGDRRSPTTSSSSTATSSPTRGARRGLEAHATGGALGPRLAKDGEAHGADAAHVHRPLVAEARRPEVHAQRLVHAHHATRGQVGRHAREQVLQDGHRRLLLLLLLLVAACRKALQRVASPLAGPPGLHVEAPREVRRLLEVDRGALCAAAAAGTGPHHDCVDGHARALRGENGVHGGHVLLLRVGRRQQAQDARAGAGAAAGQRLRRGAGPGTAGFAARRVWEGAGGGAAAAVEAVDEAERAREPGAQGQGRSVLLLVVVLVVVLLLSVTCAQRQLWEEQPAKSGGAPHRPAGRALQA